MSTWLRELYELVAWGEPHDWDVSAERGDVVAGAVASAGGKPGRR
jgi:hypothetical protein